MGISVMLSDSCAKIIQWCLYVFIHIVSVSCVLYPEMSVRPEMVEGNLDWVSHSVCLSFRICFISKQNCFLGFEYSESFFKRCILSFIYMHVCINNACLVQISKLC